MDNRIIYGYIQHALDGMYIAGKPLTDLQRLEIFSHLYNAMDILTEEEALEYYKQNDNTNERGK